MYKYELVYTGIYWYVPVHSSIYSDFLHTNAFISRYSIHHGTRQYPKVLYTWITTVQQGRRQYKALYLDVPPCTVVIQVYKTFGYFIVLPCTVMYRVTGNEGIGE